nr:GNAT family N-acetyltransferase [Solemya velum gill symbiont]
MSAILKPVKTNRLSVELATDETMIRESLELRYRIFAEEMGANLDTTEAIDEDRFDAHCHHLVVRDTRSGDLIASTRLLTDKGAADAGSFYSETEFDMQNIK